MRICHLLAVTALSLFTSCYQFQVTAQAGYSQLGLDGDLGYRNGTGLAAVQQDLQSGFGLGDDQGSPYVRAAFDFGTPVLAVSGFMFEDEGRGRLNADFGNVPANLSVSSKFELSTAKVSYSFDIPIGPVTLAPGLAVNFVDLSVLVQDTIGVASENVELQAPLPMGFLRGKVDVAGWVNLVGEVGYIQVDVEDVEAKMLDIEALVELPIFGPLNLFAGYRSIDLQGDGDIDGDSIDIDIGLSGFMIGGGITF